MNNLKILDSCVRSVSQTFISEILTINQLRLIMFDGDNKIVRVINLECNYEIIVSFLVRKHN